MPIRASAPSECSIKRYTASMHLSAAQHIESVEQCVRELRACLGDDAVLTRMSDLLAYDGDAYPMARQTPVAVALPSTTEQVAAIVRVCRRLGVPFIPRGAGTGLSGGATPVPNSVVVSLARMNRILHIDIPNRRVTAEAGCTNQAITDAAAAHGLHYAPDPSSQGVCTIGGNIAENAGGPHTLKYGVTANHVTGITLVTPDGQVVHLGGFPDDPPGLDLVGVTVGSEGTFGIVTEAIVRLTPTPEAYRTLLAVFDDVAACTRAVVEVIRAGVIPCALEMIDQTILGAIEDAFKFGFPREAAAVLTIELDGPEVGLDEDAEIVRNVCAANGAREVRLARDASDRARLWIARKKGVGTAGRLASSIVTQDGAIPRSKLPSVLAEVAQIAQRRRIRVCNIFHAGDGNLHPCVLFDQNDPDEAARVHRFNEEVLALCVAVGGTVSGEHGVGLEKREAMRLMFSPDDLQWMETVRSAFDPNGLCNPGKLLPAASGGSSSSMHPIPDGGDAVPPADEQVAASSSGSLANRSGLTEYPEAFAILGSQPQSVLSPRSEDDCRDMVRDAGIHRIGIVPWGAGVFIHLGSPIRGPWHAVRTSGLSVLGPIASQDSLVTCGAGCTIADVQRALAEHGHWIPLDPPEPETATMGGIVAANATGLLRAAMGSPRDTVVALRAITADGRAVKAGARVVKNAAGYDMPRLLAGSMGTLALITEVTLRTRPLSPSAITLTYIGRNASATLDAAWALHESRLPVQHLAAQVSAARCLISVGLSGNATLVAWLRDRVEATMIEAGLEPQHEPCAASALRRAVNGLDSSCAARISGAADDTYRIVRRTVPEGIEWTWLVSCGIAVARELNGQAHDLGTILRQAASAPPAERVWFRWLRAPSDSSQQAQDLHGFGSARHESRALMHRVKAALDPHGLFSPGRAES